MTSSELHLPLLDSGPRNYMVHHVLVDSSARAASEPNYAYTAYLGREGILKDVVSISLLSCVIPHSDSNVRVDANKIYLREYYHLEPLPEKRLRRVTATVPPGFYATQANFRLAVLAALASAVREPPLDNVLDRPEYNLVYFQNSTAQIIMTDRSPTNAQKDLVAYTQSQKPVSFSLLMTDDHRSVLYKLGFDMRHPLHTTDDTNLALFRANAVSERLVDISTTNYVDIDIPELPSAALKMTTETRRVFARVPTTSNLARSVHDMTERNVLRRHFYPVNLEKITIRLFDEYGQLFDNNGADHSLDLEIICLGGLVTKPRQGVHPATRGIGPAPPADAAPPQPLPVAAAPTPLTTQLVNSPVAVGAGAAGALIAVYAAYKMTQQLRRRRREVDAGGHNER